jgi:hypothetical protein
MNRRLLPVAFPDAASKLSTQQRVESSAYAMRQASRISREI